MTEPLKPEIQVIKHYPERFLSVIAEPESHRVNYRIVYINGIGEGGVLVYGNEFSDDIENADIALTGSVKWDGCSDWLFNDGTAYAHFCNKRSITDLMHVMADCWSWTKQLCPNWDQSLEEQ